MSSPSIQLWPFRIFSLVCAGFLAASCSPLTNLTEAAANNQIMLVREQPPSFGYQRLTSQALVHPDLGVFVTRRGLPDFLAETGNDDRRYFILYYLDRRKAYACRTRSGNPEAVEFSGPYPITKREFQVLDTFRRDPTHQPGKF